MAQPIKIALLTAIMSAWLTIAPAYGQSAAAEPVVKMSRSGICHERGTVHYQQTIYFEAFDSMAACLSAGGRRMGGEATSDMPQTIYRGTQPPRSYAPYVIMGGIFATVLVATVVLPMWRRHRSKRRLSSFQNRQRRRWEGHKLGRLEKPRR
jgi:hypothetical protein